MERMGEDRRGEVRRTGRGEEGENGRRRGRGEEGRGEKMEKRGMAGEERRERFNGEMRGEERK